jgi:regulator of RNase E activity RraA
MYNDPRQEPGMAAVDQCQGQRNSLTREQIAALLAFDTCTLANAIEKFKIRLRNEGYTLPGLRCLTGPCASVIGFATTFRIRAAEPPMAGSLYLDRADWWTAICACPLPRIAVIQDMDTQPSAGACVGEVHCAILKALGCEAVVTNGAVRDLPGVTKLGFHLFAPHIAVSHAYRHMVDYGTEVEILGLKVRSGDLLFADCHGVLSIPLDIAAELPEVAASIRARERRIVDGCLSADFSIDKLQRALHEE